MYFLILGKTIDALLKASEKAVSEINKIKNVTCVSPGGAFYVFPSCKGLLGKKIGDTTTISVPNGTVKFEILEITR